MTKRKPKRKEMQPVEKREESATGVEGEDDIRNNQAEIAHFRDIQYSFLDYLPYMKMEYSRRQHAYELLPEHHRKYMPMDVWDKKQEEFMKCILANSRFLLNVVKTRNYYTEMFGIPTHKRDRLSAPYQMSKVKSTLHQIVRDWSSEGQEERDLCYKPLLEALEKYVPIQRNEDGSVDPENQRRVLVPGCGLSRLLFEVVERGYGGQGNEFSYQMLLVSNYMLNHVFEPESIEIYPWTDNTNNIFAKGDNNRCILVPDVVPCRAIQQGSDFSMCAGEFLESYETQENEWDCVLTCFFIDTAPVVFDYIEVIHKILKPGGYWINLGPLLYHWQCTEDITMEEMDERYEQSFELSFEEIEEAMKRKGFKFEETRRVCTPYADNIRSMMMTLFRGVFFVAKKEEEASRE